MPSTATTFAADPWLLTTTTLDESIPRRSANEASTFIGSRWEVMSPICRWL